MKRLLMAAAAVTLVAGSAAAQSDTEHNRDHRAAESARTQHPDRSTGERTYRPPANGQVHSYGGQGPGVQRFTPRNDNAVRNQGYAPQNTWRDQRSGADHHTVQGQENWRNQNNGTWRGQNNGTWRNQNNGAWRGQNNGTWRGQNTWRQGTRGAGWWRGQRGFEAYEGRRDGYWFAPGWGYYRPDPRWYGFDWEVGVTVPFELRSYYISDPYAYGLPPAPYGCEWIFLDNQLVLIDMSTGQIVQIGGDY